MKPIVKLNIPSLPSDIEDKLLQIANDPSSFKYSSNTLIAKRELAQRRGITRIVAEIDKVQRLYGFDYIPTHNASRLSSPLTDEIRNVIKIDLPEETDFVVQVIDTEHTFIHDDGSRKVSFYYLLTDDETAVTRFYQTDSKPILETTYHPKDVIEVYSKHMNKGCWYAFNHQSIHAVNNVSKLRIGFLIDLSRKYTYEECMEKYKHLILE